MPRERHKINIARSRTRKAAVLALGACMALSAISCGGERAPALPLTPILRIKSRWGVVSAAYARVKADPSSQSEDISYLRKGTLVEVFAREYGREVIDEERGLWFGVRVDGKSGWVFSGYLQVFDRREQAQRASEAGG
jgi:hypothetical protein